MDDNSSPPVLARIIGGVFGFAFFGIGLSVLTFAWSNQGFGNPPLIFKLVPSFISLVFMVVGGSAVFASITGRTLNSGNQFASHLKRRREILSDILEDDDLQHRSKIPDTLSCPRCSAPLQVGADISPSGDVKCTHCNNWYNVRQQ